MNTEQYELWKMVLSSPVALTLSGAVAGSIFTLVGICLKSRFDAKESQRNWERQEQTRKEERLYQNKIDAYKKVLLWIDEKNHCIAPLPVYLNTFMAISLFAPDEIRNHVKSICYYIAVLNAREQNYNEEEIQKIRDMLDLLHEMLMEDLDKHNGFSV